ncbi:MAG: prepilin-type N-terminal cleavage/methylation domain-containing protein [Planctomycetes bacterium]|nr:prepilin-type N-terminal cleavage/methylation domain-containing protein [Planctomycetota bacterium]
MRGARGTGERGFTLIELLVVIAVMVGVMAMGAMAMGDFFGQGSFRLGVRAVVNSIHAARQTAIGQRKWVLLKFTDTKTDPIGTNDQLPDFIEIYLEQVQEDDAGAMTWVLPAGVDAVEKIELPRNIELDVMPALSGAAYAPRNLDNISGFEFFPNGSCHALDDTTKVIEVLDAVSRDRAKVFIYTVTSFVRVRYIWKE